jgi:TRAP-type C4-dicarboxylate transport system permease small subunit
MSSDAAPRSARVMAWLVVALAAIFVALGTVWYGFSPEVNKRFWHDILNRPGGPMSFRFFLQPTMAVMAAIHDGIKRRSSCSAFATYARK